MDTLEAIMTLRSVRAYSNRPVPEEALRTILRAAMQAPSARNAQPWYFVVVTERRRLDAIPKLHPYSDMLLQAPAAILVCGDLSLEEDPEYLNQDCSAATQNMLLAAHDLGLGAVWLGVYPREKRVLAIRQLFNLPGRVLPVSMVALGYAAGCAAGYPAESKEPQDRYQPERVYDNAWGHVRG
jgi:nitroreductase